MSHKGLIIEERSRDIGDFIVGRYIPFRKKRMVGPFVFIDHIGPTSIDKDHYIDVDQHPHIGLSTLTYLLAGELEHKDSLGTHQIITAGSVNLMTAGSGISHTERSPIARRNDHNSSIIHGYQIWIALPKELEDTTASFNHIPSHELPTWQDHDAQFTLIAGQGYGKVSPVPVHSPLFMIELKTTQDYDLNITDQLSGEIGILIVSGSLTTGDTSISKGNMVVSKITNMCALRITANSHVFLFGGEPLKEERFMYWNFVSSSKQKIEQAKKAWKQRTFPMMNNENSYIQLPE